MARAASPPRVERMVSLPTRRDISHSDYKVLTSFDMDIPVGDILYIPGIPLAFTHIAL